MIQVNQSSPTLNFSSNSKIDNTLQTDQSFSPNLLIDADIDKTMFHVKVGSIKNPVNISSDDEVEDPADEIDSTKPDWWVGQDRYLKDLTDANPGNVEVDNLEQSSTSLNEPKDSSVLFSPDTVIETAFSSVINKKRVTFDPNLENNK